VKAGATGVAILFKGVKTKAIGVSTWVLVKIWVVTIRTKVVVIAKGGGGMYVDS
jgi:hypothetical protein